MYGSYKLSAGENAFSFKRQNLILFFINFMHETYDSHQNEFTPNSFQVSKSGSNSQLKNDTNWFWDMY